MNVNHNSRKIFEEIKAICLICGLPSKFSSDLPADHPCKRNTFLCANCNSASRNRHLAKIILKTFNSQSKITSLKEFALSSKIKILNTSASGAIHENLKYSENYTASEYFENIKSGQMVDNVLCQNLENTSFDSDTFDLIITEDVLEHVGNPQKAFLEIKRILKPKGYHLATIPVFFDKPQSETRATIENGQIKHLQSPAFHHDPGKPDEILVFTDFGTDLVDEYCSIIGKTIVHESHENKEDEKRYAIYNNWVYSSQKEG